MSDDSDQGSRRGGDLQIAIEALAEARKALLHSQRRASAMVGSAAEKAAAIRDLRDYRAKLFNPDLFGEPAWDIMLDLFIAAERGRRLSITAASRTDNISPSTGLRWLQTLEENGMVVREADASDRRREWVSLTPDTHQTLRQWLDRA